MARKPFINHTELPYHITARCINRDWFSLDMDFVWATMVRHLYFINFAYNLRIHAFVLMHNHFHLIVRSPDGNLSDAMGFFMRETSREITRASGRLNQTYGGRFHRSLIESPFYYHHVYKYVYQNPVQAGLCERVEDYKYSALPGLLGRTWLEVPISEDENWGSLLARDRTLSWLNETPSSSRWEEVRRGLKRATFILPAVNNRISKLQIYSL